MLFRKRLRNIFLITGICFCLFAPEVALNAQEPKEEAQMKVVFYAFDQKTQSKGEFLGLAELKEGKLNIKVTDPKLEKLLKSDFVTTGGKAEEITLPEGKKFFRGGMIIYKPGTPQHLRFIMEKSQEFGYVAQMIKEVGKGIENHK